MITMEDIYERLWRDADPIATGEVMAASDSLVELLGNFGLSERQGMLISDACTKANAAYEKMGFYAGLQIGYDLCQLMGGVKNDG